MKKTKITPPPDSWRPASTPIMVPSPEDRFARDANEAIGVAISLEARGEHTPHRSARGRPPRIVTRNFASLGLPLERARALMAEAGWLYDPHNCLFSFWAWTPAPKVVAQSIQRDEATPADEWLASIVGAPGGPGGKSGGDLPTAVAFGAEVVARILGTQSLIVAKKLSFAEIKGFVSDTRCYLEGILSAKDYLRESMRLIRKTLE